MPTNNYQSLSIKKIYVKVARTILACDSAMNNTKWKDCMKLFFNNCAKIIFLTIY